MLAQRTITGVILGLLVISAIFYLSPLGFNILALLIVALAVWEFSGLFNRWNYQKHIGFLLIFLTLAILIQSRFYYIILVIGVVWWLIAPCFLWRYVVDGHNYFTSLIWQGLLGLAIFVPSWIGLVVIRWKFGPSFLLYLLMIICATDIGAYFAGALWGKHLLAPKISPKKTFAGLSGGIVLALLVAIVGILLLKFRLLKISSIDFMNSFNIVSLLLLVVVACLWSVIGDLFESMLKRQAQVKDSGGLLPGHGGVYDRIDSLTSAIPIFALGALLLK